MCGSLGPRISISRQEGQEKIRWPGLRTSLETLVSIIGCAQLAQTTRGTRYMKHLTSTLQEKAKS
jgi:hypothetical protein